MRIEPEKRKCVALIDWLNVGHHPVFYTEFALGLEAGGYDVLAICPDPNLALQLVTAGRARESFDSPKNGTIYFIRVEEPEFRLGRVRPRRIGAIYSAISKFRNLELQIAREAEMRGLEASAIVYASIYDHQFEWIHYASPFLKLPWTGLYLQAQSLKLANAALRAACPFARTNSGLLAQVDHPVYPGSPASPQSAQWSPVLD